LSSSEYTIRYATINDIDFLVEVIVQAEKSGTNILSYSSLFEMSEVSIKKAISSILEEEIDGCEFSISGFLIAEKDNEKTAAMCAWIEEEDGIPSSVLKGNLLSFHITKDALQKAKEYREVVSGLAIDYIPQTLCIGPVYVAANHRGKDLVGLLLQKHIENAQGKYPEIEVYIQVFACNLPAIKAYSKLGFQKFQHREIASELTEGILPSNKKLLMKMNTN